MIHQACKIKIPATNDALSEIVDLRGGALYMRGLLAIGIGTLLIGFILCSILASLFSSGAPEIGSSYLGFIGFSILYLASVIAVCTYMIINNKSK